MQVVDPVPEHVRQATARGLAAQLGDAPALPFPAHSAVAVLVLGQLTDPGIHRHLITVLRHGHDDAGDAFDRVSDNLDPAELHVELATAGVDAVEALGVEGPRTHPPATPECVPPKSRHRAARGSARN